MKIIITLLLALSLAEAALAEDAAASQAAPKVFCGTLPPAWLVYAVSPDALCAWSAPIEKEQKAFLSERCAALPEIGGWNAHGLNMESLLALKPRYVLLAGSGRRQADGNQDMLVKFGVQLKQVKLEALEDYPAAFRLAGELCNAKPRAEMLAASFEKSLSELKALTSKIAEDAKPSVYYACGPEGLETAAGESLHTQVIGYAGAKNAFQKSLAGKSGRFKVSIEQVLAANPDCIIARDKAFYRAVFADPRWKALPAVKARRVHLIPGAPMSWFDRPPSFMQLLGAWWLYGQLHPDAEAANWRARAQSFYKEFLNVDLDESKWKLIEREKESDERII